MVVLEVSVIEGVDLTCDQAFFFFLWWEEREKKEHLIHLFDESSATP